MWKLFSIYYSGGEKENCRREPTIRYNLCKKMYKKMYEYIYVNAEGKLRFLGV